MDIKKMNWNVVGDNVRVICTHCDRTLVGKNENITTYFSNHVGYYFCDPCCMKMLLVDSPEHIPYDQKLKYKLFKFLEKGGWNVLKERKSKKVGDKLNLSVIIKNVENPRKEKEIHYYNPDHKKLLDLGYTPTHDMEAELEVMLKDLIEHKQRILNGRGILLPSIRWTGNTLGRVTYLWIQILLRVSK